MNEYVIGADVGGTKSLAALARVTEMGHEILHTVQGGPGNPQKIDPTTAFDNVSSVITELMATAELSPNQVGSVFVAMAGCNQKRIADAAGRHIRHQTGTTNVDVVPDYELVLPPAGNHGSIAVIAGTGCIAFGQYQGRFSKAGGLEQDDIGSGTWISFRLADEIVQSNFSEETLIANIASLTGSDTQGAERLCLELHHRQTSRPALAEVVMAAAENEPVARQIIGESARELSRLVVHVVNSLDLKNDQFHMGLGGSLLTRTHQIRELLLTHLSNQGLAPSQIQIVDSPVRQAVNLACHQREP